MEVGQKRVLQKYHQFLEADDSFKEHKKQPPPKIN